MAEDRREITDREFYLDDLRQSRRLAEDLDRAEREIKELKEERAAARAGLLTWYADRETEELFSDALDRLLPEER